MHHWLERFFFIEHGLSAVEIVLLSFYVSLLEHESGRDLGRIEAGVSIGITLEDACQFKTRERCTYRLWPMQMRKNIRIDPVKPF